VKLEVGPLFQRGAAEALKDDPQGVAELYGLLRLLPIDPRPDVSEAWHTDETGELRRLRFGGYRVLYVLEEMADRVVLVQLSRDAPDAG
jgi:mRNA-degrading endonuclease RelE of RelBE toxin-antitoxin system